MPTSPLSVVMQHLLGDVGSDGGGMTDGELLARFVRSRDEDALAALVRRHAPMVWGVCRRLLHHHDAEDAFQATFLVLVRKASDVPSAAVANWLYGVARQTAVRGRATAAKRGRRETQVGNMPEPTVPEVCDGHLRAVLDEELSRLPDHYRGVVVLCDLEGMTRKEASRQLDVPEGSVASRLARARAMLARRLAKRGIVLSGSVAAVFPAGEAASVPPALVASTTRVASLLAAGQAAGVISVKVAALTEGVVTAMFVAKIKSGLALMVLVTALSAGVGLIYQVQAAEPPNDSEKVLEAPKPTEKLVPAAAKPAEKTSPKVARKEPVVLTPAEAMQSADGKKATVEFKVEYVTKSILVKTDGGKDAGWKTGHGPDDVSLRPLPLNWKGRRAIFEAILTDRAIKQLNLEKIADVAKHCKSKTVRVTGQFSWSRYSGYRTPPVLEVVVDDMSQLEVVD
jgi:RNA polymerase sigma factor (sigma-70 family)